jgi:SAM-dependent methyltransferase
MANKWTRYNRGNCPVCNGASKECRSVERDDGRLRVHCRGKVSPPIGWGFIGEDAHGFEIFVEGRTDQTERDWGAIEARRKAREAEEAKARRELTTPEQRDRVFRALLPSQRLTQRHRAELIRRGLNEQQIDLAEGLGWLKTWSKGVRAGRNSTPNNIPGLIKRWDGWTDWNETGIHEGLAIAAPDLEGRLVLHQVKPDKLPEDGGKYRFLASNSNGRLPTGEMPLPVFQHPDRPRDQRPRVWITEAYLKALITALQAWDAGYRDVVVVGCGGCNWASSPNYLREAIDRLNPAEITILPDAGWTANQNVTKQIHKLLDLLPLARVADWGQWKASKADKLDPDEVSTELLVSATRREPPKGAGSSRANLPSIDDATFDQICKRHGLDPAAARQERGERPFWKWVESTPKIPIVITEGEKNALSLLSHGFVAIGLKGCYGGYWSKDKAGNPLIRPKLIADLARLATTDRPITIAFDQDSNPSTIQTVLVATRNTVWLLEEAGCNVKIASWDDRLGRDKGAADLIANQGVEAFEQAIAAARPLHEIEILHRLKTPLGKYNPSQVVNVPDLSKEIDPQSIPYTGTLALKSGMGSGKTKLICQCLNHWKDIYPNVIAPGHREALQRGLADRLGLDYLHDTDRFRGQKLGKDGLPTKRLSLCWDSLLAINPAEYPVGSYVLVLDEVDQGLRHLILGETCGKEGKRPALMKRAIELIQGAGLVILASADLTAIELELIASIRKEQPWILENTYQRNRWNVEFIGSQRGVAKSARTAQISVIARLTKALRNGQRVFLATDTQATAERAELLALELGLKSSEILRFDRKTSADPLPRAFAENPDQFLSKHRIRLLVCSPALTSGVSIEGDHFDLVYGFFNGQSIAPWDCLQQLGRVRKPLRRVVYASWYGRSNSLSPKRWVEGVQEDIKLRTYTIAAAMGDPVIARKTDHTSLLATYRNEAVASQNEAMGDFGLQIRLRLESAGHTVKVAPIEELIEASENDNDPELKEERKKFEAANELWRVAGTRVKEAYDKGILNAEVITPEIGKALKEKRVLSFADWQKLERFEVCTFYRMNPNSLTIEAIKSDQKGKRRRALLAEEDFLWGNSALTRDRSKIDRLTQWGEPIPAQDLPTSQLRLKGAESFGFWDALAWAIENPGWDADEDSPIKTFVDRVRQNPQQARIVFGFTPHRSMARQTIFGQILAARGYKTQSKRLGTGDRKRLYSITVESIESMKRDLNNRAEIYRAQGFQLRPHPLAQLLITDVVVKLPDPPISAPTPPPKHPPKHPIALQNTPPPPRSASLVA